MVLYEIYMEDGGNGITFVHMLIWVVFQSVGSSDSYLISPYIANPFWNNLKGSFENGNEKYATS